MPSKTRNAFRFHAGPIEARSNLCLTVRERGKLRSRRKGHNIWVNLGREFLAQLIGYASYTGPTGNPERDDRIRYIGLGIGGNRQLALGVANASPLGGGSAPNHYAGTNTQNDTTASVSVMERPVRVSWAGLTPTASPYDPVDDIWAGQVAPVSHPTSGSTKFTRLFTETELNGVSSYYPTVPLSEVALFPGAYDVHLPSNASNPTNTFVAYDTFDTISKTVGVTLQVDWTIEF